MPTLNYDPNARYDQGPNAAGSNGCPQSLDPAAPATRSLSAPRTPGLMTDYTLANAHQRVGFSAAGHRRDNHGPNAAGVQRSINGT
jgi:hypothetical protein